MHLLINVCDELVTVLCTGYIIISCFVLNRVVSAKNMVGSILISETKTA